MRYRLPTPWIATLIWVAACGPEVTTPRDPVLASTAGTVVTPPGFWFLPPMVPDPGPFTGTFDPGRTVSVRISCTGATGPQCPVVATLDGTSAGAARLVVDLDEEAYRTNWHAPATLELGGGKYRLDVLEGSTVLASAELWVVEKRRDFKAMTAGHIGVVRGQPFLIKFRIETDGAAPPPPPPPTTAPTCRDCLEIVPMAILLPGLGAQQQLRAYLVDAAGQRTLVAASFSSSHPEHVVVTAAGVARATSAVGSSQIVATAGGKTSQPAMAIVATPAPGALLITDAQVIGDVTRVDDTAPYGLGLQYRFRLQGTPPAIGQMVLTTGQLPIGGRTVTVSPAGAGIHDVVLEIVPLRDLFAQLAVSQVLTLPVTSGQASSIAPAPALSTSPAPAMPAAPMASSGVQLGPFTCEAGGGAGIALPVNLDNVSVAVTGNFSVDFRLTQDGLEHFLVNGNVDGQLLVNPTVSGTVTGNVECKARVAAIPVPLWGPLSLVVGARIPIGLGFKLEAGISLGTWGVEAIVTGALGGQFGYVCTPVCGGVANLSHSFTGDLKPIYPDFSAGGSLNVSAAAFGFAELELGIPYWSGLKIKLIDARAGFVQKAELSPATTQVNDPTLASSLRLETLLSAKSGMDLQAAANLLSVSLLNLSVEYQGPPIAKTPAGTLTIDKSAVVAGDATTLGEMATFTVDLAPVTWLTGSSVRSVEIRRVRQTPGGTVLEDARPGCTSLFPQFTGQASFSCQTDFPDTDPGLHTYAALVQARVYGITVPVLLEIAPDSRKTLDVLNFGQVDYRLTNVNGGFLNVTVTTTNPFPSGGTGMVLGEFTYSALGIVQHSPAPGVNCTRTVNSSGSGVTVLELRPVTLPSGQPGFELWYTPSYTNNGTEACVGPSGSSTNHFTQRGGGTPRMLATGGLELRDQTGTLFGAKWASSTSGATTSTTVRGALKIGN